MEKNTTNTTAPSAVQTLKPVENKVENKSTVQANSIAKPVAQNVLQSKPATQGPIGSNMPKSNLNGSQGFSGQKVVSNPTIVSPKPANNVGERPSNISSTPTTKAGEAKPTESKEVTNSNEKDSSIKPETKSAENINDKTQTVENNLNENSSETKKEEKKNKKEEKKQKKHKLKEALKEDDRKRGFSFLNFTLSLFIVFVFIWTTLCSMFIVSVMVKKDINFFGKSIIYSNDDNLFPPIPDGCMCLYRVGNDDIKENDIIIYVNSNKSYCMGKVFEIGDMYYKVIGKDGSLITVRKDKVEGVYEQNLEVLQSLIDFASVKKNMIIVAIIPFGMIFVTEIVLLIIDKSKKKKLQTIQDDIIGEDSIELHKKNVSITSENKNKLKDEEKLNTKESKIEEKSEKDSNNQNLNPVEEKSSTLPTVNSVVQSAPIVVNASKNGTTPLEKPKTVGTSNSTTKTTIETTTIKKTVISPANKVATNPVVSAAKPTTVAGPATKKTTTPAKSAPAKAGEVTIKLGANAGPSTITVKQASNSKPGAITIKLDSDKPRTQVGTQKPALQPVKPTQPTANPAVRPAGQVNSNPTAMRPTSPVARPNVVSQNPAVSKPAGYPNSPVGARPTQPSVVKPVPPKDNKK